MLSLRPNSCLTWAKCPASRSRRSLHVVRFKEGDKLEEGQPPARSSAPAQVTEPDTSVHHGHIDPIWRSRDALNKLLGRHSHNSSSSSDATLSQPPASRPSRALPAFEAPLNVPVFSWWREVRLCAFEGGLRACLWALHLLRANR